MRETLFHLDSGATTHLQSRVREMLVSVILDGHLPPGSALPSSRRLAQQLGVARNTVVLAYQRLVDEGYLESRERSGFYVRAGIPAQSTPPPATGVTSAADAPDWERRLQLRPSRQRNVVKPLDWHRHPYPFIYGQFDPALFPLSDWRECARQALGTVAVREWGDHIDHDDPLLVEQIQTRLLPRRGIWASPGEILVTVGAQHAIYLAASLLIGPGTRVGVEDPGYPDTRNILLTRTRRVTGLPVDDEGMRPGSRLSDMDVVCVTPSQQSPTNVTMPLARREQLLSRAARDDFLVIEDDYETETSFSGTPTPALKSLDRSGRVIYVGSLSKTLAPGLRLGYMVAPEPLVREARALRRLMLRHPPINNQRTAALFLKLGHHDSLVRRLTHVYRERWQVLGEALRRHLPECAVPPAVGGTAYWVRGPRGLDSGRLAARAVAEGIVFEPGAIHFLSRRAPRNYLRLGFSSIETARIEPGIRRLAVLMRGGPPEPGPPPAR